MIALKRDAEISLPVAVDVAGDDGFAITEAFSQFASVMAEMIEAYQAKTSLSRCATICVNGREVDLVSENQNN